jgi:hypothetical protein
MPERDDRIYEEAAALWRSLYGEPPPADADGAVLLGLILGGLPAPKYDRLSNPHLRPASVVFPTR